MSSSLHLQQSLGEDEVFDLVCDYLRTRHFYKAEEILKKERPTPKGKDGKHSRGNNQSSHAPSKLESMLERSYVTNLVSGGNSEELDAQDEEFLRHKRRRLRHRRSNLDGNVDQESSSSASDGNSSANEDGNADEEEKLSIETKIVCYNPTKDDPHGSSSMPIYQTSTFAQPSGTEFGEYDYTRSGNPTRKALEKQMSDLEFGSKG